MRVGTRIDVITNSSTEIFIIKSRNPEETLKRVKLFISLAESWGHDDMVATVEVQGDLIRVVGVEDNSMPLVLREVLGNLQDWDNNVEEIINDTI
jgi:hypothetical protein